MSQPDKYTTERILEIQTVTPNLFRFRTTRYRGFRFIPGQFARLGVGGADGAIIWRAYSIVSASYDEHLEFFSIVVPGGAFTTRLAQLREGDEIFVEKMNYGFLTTDRFEGGREAPSQRPLDEVAVQAAEQLRRAVAAQVQVRQVVHAALRQALGVMPSQRRKVRLKLLVSR